MMEKKDNWKAIRKRRKTEDGCVRRTNEEIIYNVYKESKIDTAIKSKDCTGYVMWREWLRRGN